MEKENLSRVIHVRLEESLASELESEQRSLGYTTMSPYLRVIIERRNSKLLRKVEIPQGAISAIEHLCSEVRKIGSLYNQFVAAYNKAVKLTDRDGRPCISVKETQRNQLGLMELTMQMTSEIHALMDYLGIDHDRAKVRIDIPQDNKKPSEEGTVIIPKF